MLVRYMYRINMGIGLTWNKIAIAHVEINPPIVVDSDTRIHS